MAPRARPAYAPSSFVKPSAGPDEHAKIAATWTAKGGLTVNPGPTQASRGGTGPAWNPW